MSAVRPYGRSAGTGPVQIHFGEPLILATIVGQGNTQQVGSTRFRIITPDSRTRVKVSILFVQSIFGGSGPQRISDLGATIYMGEEEDDDSGLSGRKIICTDILRTAAGVVVNQVAPEPPLAIPENASLQGWSQELVTAADSLLGIFTTGQGSDVDAGPSGVWVLQTRFQPEGQHFKPEDWDYVIRQCKAVLIEPEINLQIPPPPPIP